MLRPLSRSRRARAWVSTALAFIFVLALLPCAPAPPAAAQAADGTQQLQIPVIPPGSAYRVTTLISDVPGLAPVLDPLLVNPWGISVRGTSPFWIVNNGTSTTQLVRDPGGAGPVVPTPARRP